MTDMPHEAFAPKENKKRPLKEIIDESLVQLNEPDLEKTVKQARIDRGVADAFIDGVEDGSVDLKTVPEKDIANWYDAVKAKHEMWLKKAKQLEDRVPTLDVQPDAEKKASKPPKFFGEKGKRSKDQIAAQALHELGDVSEQEAREARDAERTAEAFAGEIEDGSVDLKTVPEKDIPGYHRVIMKKAEFWKKAMKTLEDRITEVDLDDLEDFSREKAA